MVEFEDMLHKNVMLSWPVHICWRVARRRKTLQSFAVPSETNFLFLFKFNFLALQFYINSFSEGHVKQLYTSKYYYYYGVTRS